MIIFESLYSRLKNILKEQKYLEGGTLLASVNLLMTWLYLKDQELKKASKLLKENTFNQK